MNFEGIPEIPSNVDTATRRMLTAMRNNLLKLQQGLIPPGDPSNFKVTPIAGGNVLQFTRNADADNTIIYISPTSNFSDATPVPVGVAVQYTDNVGKGAVSRWYWLRSMRGVMPSPTFVGPQKGVTLALGVAATVPASPPASDIQVTDSATNRVGSGIQRIGGYDAL